MAVSAFTNSNNVGSSWANIFCQATGYSGDDVYYEWEINCSNGTSITETGDKITASFSNLKEGNSYNISGYCEVTIQSQDENGKWSEEKKNVEIKSFSIYTHPGKFEMGATKDSNSPDNIIANILTTDKINRWINHFQKAYHWYYQDDDNYDTSLLQIPNDKIVSANWFNACMDAMNIFGKGYSHIKKGDLITASLINQMNFTGK